MWNWRRYAGSRRLVALATVLLLVAAACGDSDDGGADGGSGGDAAGDYDLTVSLAQGLVSLDPLQESSRPDRIVHTNVYEPLVRRTADGSAIEPLLAAELPTLIDPTTWEIELRDDVTFESGDPLRAADVVSTIERLQDPDFDSQQVEFFATIAAAEAVDERTVRITTAEPDPVFVSRLTLLHIMQEGAAEAPGFPEESNGTGPYRIVSHERDAETVIEKVPDYWGDSEGAPERMIMSVVQEEATRVASLQAGEVDIVIQLSVDQVDQVPSAESVTGTESALLRLNTLDGPFTDPEMRAAVNHAIDRETIVETLFAGRAEPSRCQIAAPGVFGHTPGLETPEFDPDRSRQLLEDAGAVGTEISLASQETFARQREATQAIAQYLEDVGFTVNVSFPDDEDSRRQQFIEKDGYADIFFFQSSSEFFDISQQTQWLTSDGVFSAVSDPQLDELAQEAATTVDPEERQALYDELNELTCDEVLNVYIYYPSDIYGLGDDIEWTPRRDAVIVLTDVRPSGS